MAEYVPLPHVEEERSKKEIHDHTVYEDDEDPGDIPLEDLERSQQRWQHDLMPSRFFKRLDVFCLDRNNLARIFILTIVAVIAYLIIVQFLVTKKEKDSKSNVRNKNNVVSSWSTEIINSIPSIHYIMPATKSTHNFCFALSSALVHDTKPILIDWKSAPENVFKGKLRTTNAYLQQHTKPDDIVIMVDAFDNILQRPIDEVIGEFISSKYRILFGAEKGCCCIAETKEYPFCTKSPPSPLPNDLWGVDSIRKTGNDEQKIHPKYLNSGTIIGYAGDLLKLYTAILDFSHNDPFGKTIDDDQSMFNILFINGSWPIDLDYHGRLIKPMWASEEELQFSPRLPNQQEQNGQWRLPLNYTRKGNVLPLSKQFLNGTSPWLLQSLITKMYPGFIHLNSPSAKEHLIKPYFENSWWTGASAGKASQRRVNEWLKEHGSVRIDSPNGQILTWSELCNEFIDLQDDGMKMKL